jgi:chaperonin cofactor prefoldin
VLNEDNIRTLVMLVAMVCGVIWLNMQLDKKMDRKLDDMELKQEKKIDEFKSALNVKFEAIDGRFDNFNSILNVKFEAIDMRFEAIDRRFEAIDRRFESFEVAIDRKFDDFYVKLKTNDFAHLSAAIEALAYVLKKNDLIDSDDNKFIESKLDKS